MGKGRGVNSKGHSKKGPGFVKLRFDIMRSAAWLSLSAEAQALWPHVRHRYTGNNNGEIPYAVREAAKVLHVGVGTASRAFDELQDRGLLKCTKGSGFDQKRLAREWAFTDEAIDNEPPSNEWRTWQPKNKP